MAASGMSSGSDTMDTAYNSDHYMHKTASKLNTVKTKFGKKGALNLRELFAVFVGNLPTNITEEDLLELFEECGDVKNIYIHSPLPGMVFTYGFVRFETREEVEKAISEMNHFMFQERELNVSASNEEKRVGCQADGVSSGTDTGGFSKHTAYQSKSGEPRRNDYEQGAKKQDLYTLFSVFVGRLPLTTTKADLYELFEGCGDVINVNINTPGNGMEFTYGFVRFETRIEAESAIREMNRYLFRGNKLQVEMARGYTSDSRQMPRKSRSRSRHVPIKPTEEDLLNISELKSCIHNLQRDPAAYQHCFPVICDENGERHQVSQLINYQRLIGEIDSTTYQLLPAFTDEGYDAVIDLAELDQLLAEKKGKS